MGLFRTGRTAHLVKFLNTLGKSKDPSFIPRTHVKCQVESQMREVRDSRIPGGHWPTSLIKPASLRLVTDPASKDVHKVSDNET